MNHGTSQNLNTIITFENGCITAPETINLPNIEHTDKRTLLSELNDMKQSNTSSNTSTSLLRHSVCRILQLLNILETFHKNNHLLLNINPDNIILLGPKDQEHLLLINPNNKSFHNNSLRYKIEYSAPEVTTKNFSKISFSSDLYSVTAVFYHYLMGRSLILTEILLPQTITGNFSPLLHNAPPAIRNLIHRILKKGLHTLSEKRYQNVTQMREAFEELLQQIDTINTI